MTHMVSVIITTFGKPIYLSDSIQSVLNQSYKDIELIVVDDNNPETPERLETSKMLSEFLASDKRVKYVQHEKNRNGAVARNTGFKNSTGNYISFLDSDDLYKPDRLEILIDTISKCKDDCVAGVYSGCEFRRSGTKYAEFSNIKSGSFLVDTLACTFDFCTGSNLFVRREVYESLGGFDESFIRHQDYEFLVRLFQKYKLIAVPQILVVKNNETPNLPNVDKLISVKQQYLTKYKDIISSLPQMQQNFIYHKHCVTIIENAIIAHKYQIAFIYIKKALSYKIFTPKELLHIIYTLARTLA